MAYAFHQAAIASNNKSMMIHQIMAIAGSQMALRHGHANRISNALTKRSGGSFNALSMPKLRMARGTRAQLSKLLDLINGHIVITG